MPHKATSIHSCTQLAYGQFSKMEKLLVIQTGGTIDKCYPRAIGGYAFEFGDSSYCRQLLKRQLSDWESRFEFLSIFTKDSQDISGDDRVKLAEVIRSSDSRRILVTHGTDTLLDTARFLQSYLKSDFDVASTAAPVVILTGARLPGAFKDTDADLNIGFALGCLAAARDEANGGNPTTLLKPGVYTCMNLRLMRPDEVVRNLETGAFDWPACSD